MREKREKRNNIIIKGYELPQTGEAMRIVENIMKRYMGLDIKIMEARWIGRGEKWNKIIQAKVSICEEKKELMEKRIG